MEIVDDNHINLIINQIKGILTELAEKEYENNIGNRQWTRYILKHLKDLGHEFGFEVCPDTDNGNSEWLYDMIWYTSEEGFLKGISFVMESEWSYGYDCVRYDFEKLLQADAQLKLMICCHKNGEADIAYFKEYFSKAIEKYHVDTPKSRYIFAILKDWFPFKFGFYEYKDNCLVNVL